MYLSDKLVWIPFVPKPPGVKLSHHPVKLILQLKVFAVSESCEHAEQNLLSYVKRISPLRQEWEWKMWTSN